MCTNLDGRGRRFFVMGLALLPVVSSVNLLILRPGSQHGGLVDAVAGAMYGVPIGLLFMSVYLKGKQRRT